MILKSIVSAVFVIQAASQRITGIFDKYPVFDEDLLIEVFGEADGGKEFLWKAT